MVASFIGWEAAPCFQKAGEGLYRISLRHPAMQEAYPSFSNITYGSYYILKLIIHRCEYKYCSKNFS